MARTLEQILESEKPEVVSKAKELASAALLNINLGEVRALLEKLSSLKRYIEAAGGRVRLDIELPNGQHHEFPL